MAGTLNDEILRATGGPTVNDGLLAFYRAGGATATTLRDAERQWLLTQLGKPVSTPDTNADLWRQLLGSLPGAINDQLYGFWSGSPSSNPVIQSLFAAGEQGAWYDASDFNSQYQDSVGTIPVTAVEQPVGLVLDKKNGAQRGPELRAGFTITSTGVPPAPATYNTATGAGTVSRTDASNQSFVTLLGLNINTIYEVTLQNTGAVSISLRTNGAATVLGPVTATGQTLTYRVYPTGAGNFAVVSVTDGTTASFTVVSVKQILGNHIVMPTAAARPVVSARKNMALWSEDVSNAAWTRTGILSATATTLVEDTSTGSHNITSTGLLNLSIGGVATASAIVKRAVGSRNARLQFTNGAMFGGSNALVTFDLTTGTVSGSTNASGTITNIGGGEFFITATTVPATVAGNTTIAPFLISASTANYTGDGVSSLAWRNIQMEPGLVATTYQRITTATVYDTVGFPLYWTTDGVDDGFQSAVAFNMSASDKVTVWAGITKLTDAAVQVVAELGNTGTPDPGSFAMFAPLTAAASNVAFRSVGTTSVTTTRTNGTLFAAPFASVLTGIADISGLLLNLRVNTVPGANNPGSQGTGNYSATLLLNVGKRAGSTVPLNGRIYQIIIRGAASTAGQITSTEQYIAGKMQITIP